MAVSIAAASNQVGYGADAAAPSSSSEIPDRMSILGDRLINLEGLLSDLLRRIEPVMRPSVPSPNDAGKADSGRQGCPVGNQLSSFTSHVDMLSDAVRVTLDRLAL